VNKPVARIDLGRTPGAAPVPAVDLVEAGVLFVFASLVCFFIAVAAGCFFMGWNATRFISSWWHGRLNANGNLLALVAQAFALACGLAAACSAVRPSDGTVHNSGGRLFAGRDAARRTRRDGNEKSLFKVAGLHFNLDRLRRSFLIFGSIGSGKTQVIWNLLKALYANGFRMLVVDGPKGDYSAGMPPEWMPLIVAPWSDGPAWDVAADCPTRNHAMELAAVLVAEGRDPMWSNSARSILIACLCCLQETRGQAWGWADLYRLTTLPAEQLFELAAVHYPPAAEILRDPESKTTQSILINLSAYLQPVGELAVAWKNKKERFSFTGWWAAPEGKGPQVVVLQGSAEFSQLAGAYIAGIVKMLAAQTASPAFPESKTRKNAVVIDELAQLPKIGGFEKFFEIGRSKGCSAIVASQSPAQVQKIWGELELKSWSGMIGTKVFGRTLGQDDQAFAVRELGEREILVPQSTVSSGAAGTSETRAWRKERLPVVRAEDLADLGPTREGVETFVGGFGQDVLRVTFPYVSLGQHRSVSYSNPDFDKPFASLFAPAGNPIALTVDPIPDALENEPADADAIENNPKPLGVEEAIAINDDPKLDANGNGGDGFDIDELLDPNVTGKAGNGKQK
jgi:hypothetical protein